MTWPEAFYDSVLAICWTFIVWRGGGGILRLIQGR